MQVFVVIDKFELKKWEAHQKTASHPDAKPGYKRPFDPEFERLKKRRRNLKMGSGNFKKERKDFRKAYQRQFRMKMKMRMARGDYYNPGPHEYKTYGYLTW